MFSECVFFATVWVSLCFALFVPLLCNMLKLNKLYIFAPCICVVVCFLH